MLEAQNLTKIYKPKRGVPVVALNAISIKFPSTGMVFLLGKSGSGKSTLLNVLGGLDKYDSGDIIIKGMSTKNFGQSHFDSYRNTYVGFIFQEYNILEEFTVGANIALAIELQNRKATDSEINEILHEVDLDGYGSRKPNELSGGQKQRVAIARALIKKPEIIMADEPTGALDSATGKQVFDTLKKLSKHKLVIIVSHDREFSELYADRIIELADGNIISDMEYSGDTVGENESTASVSPVYSGRIINVPAGYQLTEEDRIAINDYISRLKSGADISVSEKVAERPKFVQTDTSKIQSPQNGNFNLIKSHLPMHNAFRIGASGLKHKKIRLTFTVLLSFIAFTLFGLSDTFGAYDKVEAGTQSIIDSGIDYASFSKNKFVEYENGEGYWDGRAHNMNDDDIRLLRDKTGLDLSPAFVSGSSGYFYDSGNSDMSFSSQIDPSAKLTQSGTNVYATSFSGFTEVSKEQLDSFGYNIIAGNLPDGSKNEIAISKYVCETFLKAGYTSLSADITLNNAKNPVTYEAINDYAAMVGKTLFFGKTEYTVTGIIDTNFDLARYLPLADNPDHLTDADYITRTILAQELQSASKYSLTGLAIVGHGFINSYVNKTPMTAFPDSPVIFFDKTASEDSAPGIFANQITTLDNAEKTTIHWVDGEKSVLGDKEIIVSAELVLDILNASILKDYSAIAVTDSQEMFYSSVIENADDTSGNSAEAAIEFLKTHNEFQRIIYGDSGESRIDGYRIVGVISTGDIPQGTIVLSDKAVAECSTLLDGSYFFAIGAMPDNAAEVRDIVKFSETGTDGIKYSLNSAVIYELDLVSDIIKVLANVFLYIGIGFALFSALMLSNFIATSISYKKQEIGILRAIGSRSSDVFRIFFSESFIIAFVNFILSCIMTFSVVSLINNLIRQNGILITVLNFGIRQVVLLLLISLGIAALASFIPVYKIASKRPIDAIRNR